MTDDQMVRVHLELDVGDALRGRAVFGAGTVRRFTGFVGLVAVLDALIEDSRAGRLELHAENVMTDRPKGAGNVDE